MIAKIDETIMTKALFLTLTYPKGDEACTKHVSHLDSLLKRLLRMAPGASAIWKLEWTKAGTPHYHLLLMNLKFWDKKKVAKAWAEIVDSDHPDHEKVGTRIERLCVHTQAAKYVCKYVSKTGQVPPGFHGRIWGKCGAMAAAYAAVMVFGVSREVLKAARRQLDALRKSYNRAKRFRRASNMSNKARWFLTGREVIRYLTFAEANCLLASGP